MTIKTIMNKNVSKEISRRALIVFLILFIVGLIGVVSYIILASLLEDSWYFNLILYPSAILFSVGLIFELSLLINLKKVKFDGSNYNETTFNEDHLINKAVRQNEVIDESKIYYKNLVAFKETKTYIFLYITKSHALPITKENNRDALLKIIVENRIKPSKL